MVRVTSEVGRLRQVLVHEPGPEVDRMVPSMMEELLFDDILFGERAREEHRRFRRLLQLFGIEVLDAEDLLEETLRDQGARTWILDILLPEQPETLRRRMREAPTPELTAMLVGGVRIEPFHPGLDADELFLLSPLPNWCFQRDSQIVVGKGVVFAAMATPARHRESLLARVIFGFHPRLAPVPVLRDPHDPGRERPSFGDDARPRLEGGDVLVLSPDVLAVGHSERSNKAGIEQLARALAGRDHGPRYMIVVELPRQRAYMHLDTLMTPIDRDAALVYPPVVLKGGSQQASTYEIDLHARSLDATSREDFLSALSRRGLDLEPIPCGGPDPLVQQREQWTDGANALALAPGIIAMYDRNTGTAEELSRHGFRLVEAEDLLLGREEIDLDADGRACILVSSHEISRARGGPHCLTHPLVRDDAL